MPKLHNKKLVPNAKGLRKNMTKEERHLWYDFLRTYTVRFMRQRVIGNYIVDFYCAKAQLIIELDGSQHYEKEALEKDKQRSAILEQLGMQVLRFTNEDINKHFDDICEYIDIVVKKRTGQ